MAHSILGWKELKFVRITFCCQKLLSNFQDIFYSYHKAELIKKFCNWCSGEHYGLWASYIINIVYDWWIKCLREFFLSRLGFDKRRLTINELNTSGSVISLSRDPMKRIGYIWCCDQDCNNGPGQNKYTTCRNLNDKKIIYPWNNSCLDQNIGQPTEWGLKKRTLK